MSLTIDGSISLSSVTIQDVIIDEANNNLLILESTGPTLRKFSLATLSQVGSNITTQSNPRGIAMVDGLSAAEGGTGTTIDLIEIASGYRTNHAGGAAMASLTKNQTSAGDTTNKIALFCGSSSRIISKFNANTFTASSFTVPIEANSTITCIIFKGSGRFLLGDSKGGITEIDGSGVVYNQFYLSTDYMVASQSAPSSGAEAISFMCLDGNLLYATTKVGIAYVADISTHTIVNRRHVTVQNGQGQSLSNSFKGTCLMSRSYTTAFANTVSHIDFTTSAPPTLEGTNLSNAIFHTTGNTGQIIALGINTTNGKGFAVQTTSGPIRVFSVTARDSTAYTDFTLPVSGDEANLIIMKDNGVGSGVDILLDTKFKYAAGVSYRIPDDINVIQIVRKDNGVRAGWKGCKYST